MVVKTLLLTSYFDREYVGFPLGIAYLASVLEKNGKKVDVLDVNAKNISKKKLHRIIKKEKPDLIGISCNTGTYKEALEIARISKDAHKKCKVVIGGPHSTFSAKTILEYHPQIDFCILGEAEYTLLELVDKLENNINYYSIKGLGYRNGKKNKIFINPLRRFIENLDEIPFPSWHLFDLNNPEVEQAYNLPIFKGDKSITIISSRGCYFTCSYCYSEKFWGNRIRYRSPKNVLNELKKLKKIGFKSVFFEDDTFTMDRKRVIDICKLILQEGLEIKWGCASRVDRVDLQLLKTMKKAGCIYIYYGIESSNQEIIDRAGKEIKIEDSEKAFELMRKVGITSEASIQFGLPGETIETAKNTIYWLKNKLKPDRIAISLTSLYPGTVLAYTYNIDGNDYEKGYKKDLFSQWKENKFIHGVNVYQTDFCNETNLKIIYKLVKKHLGAKIVGGYINK
ncbi:radical SAM protein [Candidatus Woesearchaeota archaeon]|nr:radical SAM protein [Candidatus Woesearchaeota archaeon]